MVGVAEVDGFGTEKTKTRQLFDEGREAAVVKRRNRLQRNLDYYTEQNQLYRKPCSSCGNLVKPELIDQHFAAYHSTFEGKPSVVS